LVKLQQIVKFFNFVIYMKLEWKKYFCKKSNNPKKHPTKKVIFY